MLTNLGTDRTHMTLDFVSASLICHADVTVTVRSNRAPRRNFPAKPSLHRRLPPGCNGCAGKSRNPQCSRRWLEVCPTDSRVLLRTVACPSRVQKVSGPKSRGPPFHGPPGAVWSVSHVSIFEIWLKCSKSRFRSKFQDFLRFDSGKY